MTINFPKLTSYQQESYDWLKDPYQSGKVLVIKSVRQSGKTFFIQVELIIMALLHPGSVSIIYEPTLALARNVFKSMDKTLEENNLLKSANAQLLEIEFNNGSQILFKSTEQMSRGLTVSGLLVLDECAYLDNEQIFSILPLVNAKNAPVIICSTPFCREGYFYEMYLKGLNEESELIRTFDWSKNKEIEKFLTPEKRELYRQTMSRQKFQTEILGEFLTNDGLLFQGMDKCIGAPDDSSIINIGIDFGAGTDNDYTVLSVINNLGHMVQINRTNHLSPMEQVDWLIGLIEDLKTRYEIATILCEYNSIGSVYIDAMKKKLPEGLILTNWTTTNKSKQDLVTSLQIAIENGRIRLLNEPNLLNELRHYQADINVKTKTVTYNGYKCNDDMVMATMFAWWAYQKRLGNFSLSFA